MAVEVVEEHEERAVAILRLPGEKGVCHIVAMLQVKRMLRTDGEVRVQERPNEARDPVRVTQLLIKLRLRVRSGPDELIPAQLVVLVVGEAARNSGVPRGVMHVGDEAAGEITAIPESLGERWEVPVERGFPVASLLAGAYAGEHRRMRRKRPRGRRECPLEHGTAAAPIHEVRCRLLWIAVEAERRGADGVEDDDQDVRR